jgi:hypothetical protein
VQEPNIQAPAQAGVALRLFWMMLGHAIVFASLAIIAIDELGFPTILDGIVWLTVALMIVARRVDITRWRGTTADGEPATLAHWRVYTLTLVAVVGAASVLAHMVGGMS